MRPGAAAGLLVLATLATGCLHHASDRIAEPWRFEAQATRGVVRVLPVIALHDPVEVELGSFVGRPVPWERARIRSRRTEALARVPAAMGERLAGAVNGQLAGRWSGQFRHGAWPAAAREKLRGALRGPLDWNEVDRVLGELGSGHGGQATLVTWVRSLQGDPVSLHGFPDAVVDTAVGPIFVDHRDEPYVVTVGVGVALVSEGGEVLIRYEHDYHALLSGGVAPEATGARLARAVAEDVTKVWAVEAELAPTPARYARTSRAP